MQRIVSPFDPTASSTDAAHEILQENAGPALRLIAQGSGSALEILNGPDHLGIFNVSAYGAKLDGVTNDSSALNKAISAASAAGGGNIVVPAGKTLDAGGATIALPSKVNLIGSGPGA